MTPDTPVSLEAAHPAKFSPTVLDAIRMLLAEVLPVGSTILDPFAGIGGIHQLSDTWQTYAVEIEPEWAVQSARMGPTWCGDFFEFDPDVEFQFNPYGEHWKGRFDAIVTSPAYGNRMADHHNARDASKRITYRHKLGRPLSDNNSGKMQWGAEYKLFHGLAWKRVLDILSENGWFVLNVSNHIRGELVMPVVRWHRQRLERLGMRLVVDHKVSTPRMGFGANGQVRVGQEHVLVFRRGDA